MIAQALALWVTIEIVSDVSRFIRERRARRKWRDRREERRRDEARQKFLNLLLERSKYRGPYR